LTGVSHHHADGIVGTLASDDAVGFDPLPVLGALADEGAPAVVFGQVAGIMHGSSELTGDLDLLWSGHASDAERMASAFTRLGAALFDDSLAPIDHTPAAFTRNPKVVFRTRGAAGDCCTPGLPWGDLDVASFLHRAESTRLEGILIRFVSLNDLISMRRMTSRPKDIRRMPELERLAAGSGRGGTP
jgi:hypothetical protein